MSALAELPGLIQEKATTVGRMASAFPGLWFFRSESPRGGLCARAGATYVGIAGRGRKRIHVGGLELFYDPEHVIVLRANTDYQAAIELHQGAPYVALGLELPPGLVVRTLLDLVENGHPEPPAGREPAWNGPLEEWLAEPLCRLLRSLDDRVERSVLAPLALREVVFRLLTSSAAPILRGASVVNGERARIGAAMAYLEANAGRRLTVEAVARQHAMSPSHFAHVFRAVAGMAPMRYLKEARLERARLLLLGEGLGAATIAARVGYASASHFSRDFKGRFGLTPARYAWAFARASTALSQE